MNLGFLLLNVGQEEPQAPVGTGPPKTLFVIL